MPKSDSIEHLARFWDSHDLTDFEAQLEEVNEPVLLHGKPTTVAIRLSPRDARALRRIAKSKGLTEGTLVRNRVLERLRKS